MKQPIYYLGVILGFALGAIVMNKPPVEIIVNHCWEKTFKGSFSTYRIPCPKGME